MLSRGVTLCTEALQCVRMSLPVDIIGHIAPSTSLGDVRAWFLERLQTQLEACLESILKHSEVGDHTWFD
jgi:hypothetical protein